LIDRIQGTILEKQPPALVIVAANIGYEVICPMSVFYNLPDINTTITLFTHFVVREDAQLLYGFTTKEERQIFRKIIGVNGIGPKIALAILSTINITDFINCIKNQEVNLLTKVPGIGKKTAERLLMELKDKIVKFINVNEQTTTTKTTTSYDDNSFIISEALQALVSLGYKKQEAEKIVTQFNYLKDYNSTEALIRLALKSGSLL
jgi:Holliday junction DNA helicase RuvA